MTAISAIVILGIIGPVARATASFTAAGTCNWAVVLSHGCGAVNNTDIGVASSRHDEPL